MLNYCSKKDKIIILATAKAGSTSLAELLQHSSIAPTKPLIKVPSLFYHPTLSEICYSFRIQPDKLNEYKIIQIVRNPYDRFISSYFSQAKLFPLLPNLETVVSNLEKVKFLLPQNEDLFYASFYGSLDYKSYSLTKTNSWGGMRFWYEQNYWNNLNADVNVFKLEDLNKDSRSLTDLIGMQPIQFPVKRKGTYDTPKLSKELKNRVYSLYQNDFKLFKYRK